MYPREELKIFRNLAHYNIESTCLASSQKVPGMPKAGKHMHNKEKNLIENSSEMTQVTALVQKDIKTAITNILHKFKKV